MTRASDEMYTVVLRRDGNRGLVDTCRQWAYGAITSARRLGKAA